ncbi:hypothetical protein ACH4VR_15070 [Streptomyces sp. NPDC020883]|uniref:hypothetical protein n=1 Tax=unclassified Streptomyces TaxID=2593676 RepID=UPI0034E26CF8
MNKSAVAGCLAVGLAVLGFLTATGTVNIPIATGAGVALFIAAGVEIKRKKPTR